MSIISGLSIASLSALVLAGGLGTRLRPVTGHLPKVLVPVAGHPFLHYVFWYLSEQGVRDVVICTGYAAEQVRAFCKDGAQWKIRIRYSSESRPLGTGGAVGHARSAIRSNPFLVLNGDSLVRAELASLVRFHAERQAQISMVLVNVPNKAKYGSVALANDGSVVSFAEKTCGGSGLVNAGMYLMERGVLDVICDERIVSLEHDVFPQFVGKRLYGMLVPGPFIDIGRPESYAMAQCILQDWAGKSMP